jgi:hypothetical protein
MLFLSIRVETIHDDTAVHIHTTTLLRMLVVAAYIAVGCSVLRALFAVFHSLRMLHQTTSVQTQTAAAQQSITNKRIPQYSVEFDQLRGVIML